MRMVTHDLHTNYKKENPTYRTVDDTEVLLNSIKGDILKEFEKVCPTEISFKRVKKEVHNIFETLQKGLEKKQG